MFSERMATARTSRFPRLQDDVDTRSEATDLNESLTLPRVEVALDNESMDGEKFSSEEFYQERISCQNKYTIKILALILMDAFVARFGLTDVSAASEAGHIVGYSERSVRTWHKEFYENEGELVSH